MYNERIVTCSSRLEFRWAQSPHEAKKEILLACGSEIRNRLRKQYLSHGNVSAKLVNYFKIFVLRALIIVCIRLRDVKAGLNLSIAGREVAEEIGNRVNWLREQVVHHFPVHVC